MRIWDYEVMNIEYIHITHNNSNIIIIISNTHTHIYIQNTQRMDGLVKVGFGLGFFLPLAIFYKLGW